MVVTDTELVDPDLDTAGHARAITHTDEEGAHVGERGIAQHRELPLRLVGVGAGEEAVEGSAPATKGQGGIALPLEGDKLVEG